MQLNKVRNWNVNLKIIVAFLSIGILPSIFGGVTQLISTPDKKGVEVELLTEKATSLAEKVTKGGEINYVKLHRGVRELIPEVSQPLLDGYFYLNLIGNTIRFVLVGGLLAFILFPKGFESLGYKNTKPILFFGAIVMALNIPVIAGDAMGLNEMLGLDKLQIFFFGSDFLTDTSQGIKELAFMFPNENRGYIICWIGLAVVPALGEELIFRGVLQRLFTDKFGNFHNGIALSAFIFAAFHPSITNFFYYFILGVILGYIYYWGKSIVFPIMIHLLNNSSVLLNYFSIGALGDTEVNTTIQNGNPFNLMGYLSVALILFIFYMNFKRSEMENQNLI
jgi:membrane protease YdiL (CAAX protease family)